jgi:hypothetical protein
MWLFGDLGVWFRSLGTGDKIATIATLVGFLQFVALMLTVRVMRRSARQQLRAYVSGDPNFMFAFDEAHLPRSSHSLRNVGQTPAYDLTHRSAIVVAPHPPPRGYRFPPLTGISFAPPIVLFPGLPFTGTTAALRCFSANEIAGIRKQTSRIYIIGEIRYRDAFRRWRWTRFAASVVADEDTLVKLSSNYRPSDLKLNFERAPVGNDAK